MTAWHHYSELEACIETETDWTGDHVIRRFVIVTMTDDRDRLDTAVCQLTFQQAREIAFELLGLAESTDPQTHRSDER
jgi:hypothetical protein